MTVKPRLLPTRTRALARELGAVGIVLLLVIVGGGVSVAANAPRDGVAHVGARATSVPCASPTASETATTNQKDYGPGSVVTMTASIHNTSTKTCSTAVGPTSPSIVVDNSSGVEVWSSCGGAGKFHACALYLIDETLQPGATYTKTSTWNQRSGTTGKRVPVGTYVMTAHFNGITGQASTKFNLTATTPPRIIHVTESDSGHSYSVPRGTQLLVQLSGPTIYTWTEPISSNPAVLKRTSGSSGSGAAATFVAEAKGEARVTAVGNPTCYPQCLMPSRLFTFTVSVVG